MSSMIIINKEEKLLIEKHFPKIKLDSTRHKYFLPELRRYLELLVNNPQAVELVRIMEEKRIAADAVKRFHEYEI